jgi:hypothetical protein
LAENASSTLWALFQRRYATEQGKEMDFEVWRSAYRRGFERMRGPRLLIVAIAASVVLASGLFYVFIWSDRSPPAPAAIEEPCTNGPGGDRVGYLRTILLCPIDSPQCKPDQVQVFRAQHSSSWSSEAMLIPDIPDGYIITGGDLLDPSAYRVASLGFNRISVTNYVSASDYCTQHYWYYLRANWISSDPSDKLRIKICVYYDKWQGAQPPEKCSPPVVNPPE